MFAARRPARCVASSPRPKGLWKARSRGGEGNQSESSAAAAASPSPSPLLPPISSMPSLSRLSSSSSTRSKTWISLEEDAESSSSTSSSSSSYKRRRVLLGCGDEENQVENPSQVYLWDYSPFRPPSTSPASMKKKKVTFSMPRPRHIPRQRVYSSIGSLRNFQEGDDEFTWEDWEDLLLSFSPFEENFEADSTSIQYLPTLRAIIHECHRFISLHPNPSSFFIQHSSFTPPTTVYTLLGHTLFVFGVIISIPSNASEALDTEPKLPSPYWLAALNVFSIGDSLAAEDEDLSSVEGEVDWKMSLTWGMTMIHLARELVEGKTLDSFHSSSSGSPLEYITLNRPPHTTSLEVKDLLKYAMDQVTRGIFHMPRLTTRPLVANTPSSTFISLSAIAVEVLRVASQLTSPSDRVYWLRWADSLFSSVTVGTVSTTTTTLSSMSIGGPPSDMILPSSSCSVGASPSVSDYRGNCNLLLARALVEAGAGVGEEDEWKEEVRDALQNAIEFLEEALGAEAAQVGLKRKWSEREVVQRADEVERMLREARELVEKFN